MALTNDQVIWTGKSTGVTLEEWEGKISLKGVRKYQKGGEDVLTYDWVYAEVYDKEAKKRVMAEKPRPISLYLGEKKDAIEALEAMLYRLGASLKDVEPPPF
jgi:hypothetical protein